MAESRTILVIDGQGGGIGATIIKALRETFLDGVNIWALGTNSTATQRMMKAGANRGATGENAFVHTVGKVDVILGPVSIVLCNSMMGEVTTRMAEAVVGSKAVKFLLPLTQENVTIVGASKEPLPHLVEQMIREVKEVIFNV